MMSIQFLPGKLKGEERKTIIQTVQKRMQEAAIGAIDLCSQSFVSKK